MSYEPDYYNCAPCDFETPSCEEYGYRWDCRNLEYVRIEEDEQDDFDSLDLEDQLDQLLNVEPR